MSAGKELWEDYKQNDQITAGGAVKASVSGVVSGTKAVVHAGAFAVGGVARTVAATGLTAPMTFVESVTKDVIDGKEANMSKALTKTGIGVVLGPALTIVGGGGPLGSKISQETVKSEFKT